jgi:hypothetical protein
MHGHIPPTNNPPRIRFYLPSLSITLGLIVALCGGSFGGDGVSYLDMGDYFFAGDRKAIINGLWSPLFPFLQGLTRWLFKPTMRWEPVLVQSTNFVIYVSTVLAFHFFWNELFRLNKTLLGKASQASSSSLSANEFWIFGYSIFLFAHLDLVTSTTPDMLLSTMIYLLAAQVLRIRLRGITWPRFCLLGLLLGAGFLAKAVMLPLAGAFLLCVILPHFRQRFLLVYGLAALAVFVGVVSPYLYELAREKGQFTTGEAAGLNYAWHVNGAPFAHWQGELVGLGTPEHPTRKISSSPNIYEFATPVRGTYPPWYDPSYWNRGLRLRFDIKNQLAALRRNLKHVLRAFRRQTALVICVLLLIALRRDLGSTAHDFFRVWYLWFPAWAALGLYCLVWVEDRYLAEFFVLLWAGILISIRFPNREKNGRFVRMVTSAAMLILAIQTGTNIIRECTNGHRAARLQMAIAQGLIIQGVQPGEKVAVVDAGLGEDWQKLMRVVVVAEIPLQERETFWCADIGKRNALYQALAKTGANVVIASEVPDWASTESWRKVQSTPAYIYWLNPREEVP